LRYLKSMLPACQQNFHVCMAKKFPIHPLHPERNCWGCDKYCPSTSLACGNGSERTQHPMELFGVVWAVVGLDPFASDTIANPAKITPS
jgi:hypothetical protein